MTTPALRVDPYVEPPPAKVTALVGWEAAAWHAPDWWRRHWALSGLQTDVSARMQEGSREDWVLWSQALDEDGGGVLDMLTALPPGDIGFAVVSATKR